jgi:hypothetical protein
MEEYANLALPDSAKRLSGTSHTAHKNPPFGGCAEPSAVLRCGVDKRPNNE